MRILITGLILALSLLAQDAPKKKGGPPKNLQLLKPEEVRPKMAAFTAALGGKCDMCHVAGDRASDDKKEKVIARKMIVMTREINAKFPDGGAVEHVTCFTCHRGSEHPATEAPAAPPAN
jgi:photosynthetic reaction center cytochrome c subunit